MPECDGTMINTYREDSCCYQNAYIFSGNRKMEINQVFVTPKLCNFETCLKNKDLKWVLGNFFKCCNGFLNMHF